MSAAADWMVVAGFVLAGLGVILRTVILMRFSDALPVSGAPLHGRQLLRAYRASNPASKLPVLMWATLVVGLVLLVAGLLLEFR
jgi:CHASE2 domain-containing sensor protein